MNKIYYKVVYIENDRRLSAWLGGKSDLALEYPIKSRVEANPLSMGIFVFESIDLARKWRRRIDRYPLKIIKCIGHGRGKRKCKMIDSYIHIIRDFFYVKSQDPAFQRSMPEGTVVFPAITTLE